VQVSRGNNEPLSQQYDRVRQHALAICEPLAVDDYGVQPVPDVSPPKWHLAHTSWFFETFLLKPKLPGYQAFDPAYEYLFNSYYNGVGAQHPRTERGNLSRPTVDEVYAYRAHVDDNMHELLESAESSASGPLVNELTSAVVLGLQHEQQHQELLVTDIKYILGNSPVQAPYSRYSSKSTPNLTPETSASRAVCDSSLDLGDIGARTLEFRAFEGGVCEIGVDPDYDGFCFDNETPRHKQWLEPFKLANRLINNSEYLEFVADGGYERSELWLSEGWAAVQAGRFGKTPAPLYWRKRDGHWYEYILTGLSELRPQAAVSHLSYYEADAYARWAGYRLASEAEWEVAAHSTLHLPEQAKEQEAEPKLIQMTDSLWQWTQSAYSAYPGFKPLPGTLGEYNGKFMSGQMVLRGGSVATPEGHARLTYRNFFYPPDRWQFTGIRLAADVL